jgi:hypothetical protein
VSVVAPTDIAIPCPRALARGARAHESDLPLHGRPDAHLFLWAPRTAQLLGCVTGRPAPDRRSALWQTI